MRFILSLFLGLSLTYAEESPIMTLDVLADVYYDAETGDPIVADEIKALNGKEVRIAGYMVPFNDLENLKEFMLMPSSNGCNFCESPMKEEMVYVRQPGKKKYDFIGDPLVLTGKLWVQGAGTPAPNSTYAQFLYALQDAEVELLKSEDHALLQVVTPRTIIKQVCSLLRVRLLKQVTFIPLDKPAYQKKREELLSLYLGGEKGLANLKLLLNTFQIPEAEQLMKLSSDYLANWSAAFCNPSGEEIYYLEDMDLSLAENQLQIAISCYDLLFAQEVNLHEKIHQGSPSYDELVARLSLILGLRQSFAQFYGSIGLIDMLPLQNFAQPYAPAELPKPYGDIAYDLLVNTEPFIAEIYKAEMYQPYTKAIQAPPTSTAQILAPAQYTTDAVKGFTAPQLDGYENRLGPYLSSKLLDIDVDKLALQADGIRFAEGTFRWELKFQDADQAKKIAETIGNGAGLQKELKAETLILSSANVTPESE